MPTHNRDSIVLAQALSALIADFLHSSHDSRNVIADPQAKYFGLVLDDGSLVPGSKAHLGATHYESWLTQNAVPA